MDKFTNMTNDELFSYLYKNSKTFKKDIDDYVKNQEKAMKKTEKFLKKERKNRE